MVNTVANETKKNFPPQNVPVLTYGFSNIYFFITFKTSF